MRHHLSWVVSGTAWLLVIASFIVIAGSLSNRPVLVASVPTGSMVPSLTPGDLIPMVPLWFWGPPAIGDIVVFRSRNGPQWIVHRIIRGNPREGFVTKGDANPLEDPDQVIRADIVGAVPVLGGRPLRIRGLGMLSVAHSMPSRVGLVTVGGIAAVLFLLASGHKGPRRRRPRRPLPSRMYRGRMLLFTYCGFSLMSAVTSLFVMALLSSRGTEHFGVVAYLPANVHSGYTLVTGEVRTEEHTVKNPTLLPIVVIFQTDNPALRYDPSAFSVLPHRSVTVRSSLVAGSPGDYVAQVHQAVYPHVLPMTALTYLARLNPALPLIAVAVVPASVILILAFSDPLVRWFLGTQYLRVTVLRAAGGD